MINFMSNLKVWVSQFRVEESQTSHGPRHICVYFLLTLQRITDVCTQAHQVAPNEVVRDVPASVAAVLDAQVAHHAVEVIDRHVERLGHLCRRQRVLGLLVQHAKRATNNGVESWRPCASFVGI